MGASRPPPPNIFKFTRKLVKSQPCCKRVGHNIFCVLLLVTIVGQSVKPSPPTEGVSAHYWTHDWTPHFATQDSVSLSLQTFARASTIRIPFSICSYLKNFENDVIGTISNQNSEHSPYLGDLQCRFNAP